MKLTRRTILAGALAAPAAASAAGWRWRHGHGTVLLYDAALEQGRIAASASQPAPRTAIPIEGERIHFAREIVARRPAVIEGVTRQADLVLIEDVAAEAGYERVALKVTGDVMEWRLMPRIRGRG